MGMALRFDAYAASAPKAGEDQCGDVARVVPAGGSLIGVLADGIGSGFRANVIATLTVRMLTTMLESGEKMREAVGDLLAALPVSSERGIGYAAFTALRVSPAGRMSLVEVGTPRSVLLRRGRAVTLEPEEWQIGGVPVHHTDRLLAAGDTVVAYSDGLSHAGIGCGLDLGLGRKNIVAYLEQACRPGVTAERLTRLLLRVGVTLYQGRPGDDVSVLTLRALRHSR